MMKLKTFALLAGAAILAAGCTSTVSDTHTFASTWSKDTFGNRYQRSVEQVYQAAVTVVQNNGVLITEYIPHDNTNATRSLQAKVNQNDVWIRVEQVDPRTSQVDVQARGKWGGSNPDLAHELATEIGLQLAR